MEVLSYVANGALLQSVIQLAGELGVPASIAVVAVLTYRLISFWLPALAGIPIAVMLQSRDRN